MEKLVIIDGNSLINRAFYALPMLTNFEGEISNAVFGFTNILVKVINELKPDYLCVAFDYGKKTFRNELYSDYKGTRKQTPTELVSQFPILKTLLNAMHIKTIEREGIEADDIIGSLTKLFPVQNIVVTGDKDSFQLINKHTSIMFTKKGISETVNYDPETLFADYGITPEQVVDLKSLMGDASDNIPGVAGIGEKTALSLIEKYGSLNGVYEHLLEIGGKLQEKLQQGKDSAYLSYTLATIKTDVPLNVKLTDLKYEFPFNESVLGMFKKYQFNSLLKRSELFAVATETSTQEQKNVETVMVTPENFATCFTQWNKAKEMSLVFDHNIHLFLNNKEFICNFNSDLLTQGLDITDTLNKLKPILENPNVQKTVFDYKATLHKLVPYEMTLNGVSFDVVLARYLINNNAKVNASITEILSEQGLNEKQLAYGMELLKQQFLPKLKQLGLEKLYYEMEMPLSQVLFQMEQEGFKIDLNALDELDKKYATQMANITQEIYQMVGYEFNINSPKQLSDVLFNKLGIVAYNNKKNSTGIDVLSDIEDKHPVVPMVMEYRKIAKLYSTYIKAFGQLVNPNTHKIHTLFNQTVTATGRLSSIEPNLQNIPIRSEEGKLFRKIFVPTQPSGFIVTADYSQIELRLLAIFSEDEKLIEAFNNGEDIHAKTASEVFGVPLSSVTSSQRRDAKAINFGIVYGISDYGLAQNISTTRVAAASYIKRYFEKYPKVKEYMDANIAFCKQNGFVKTLFGRIRNIAEINSTNYNLRQFGERAAMNMPLQGSASDIIKLAMVKVAQKLEQEQLKSKLILQIHDELLVDCYEGELEKVESILKHCMEEVVKLPVKLSVNVEHGKNWYEAK